MAGSEKSTEEIIQHQHLLEIGMVTVGKIAGNADGSLNPVRVVQDPVFLLNCGIEPGLVQLRLRRSA